jgi:hypothetical protein
MSKSGKMGISMNKYCAHLRRSSRHEAIHSSNAASSPTHKLNCKYHNSVAKRNHLAHDLAKARNRFRAGRVRVGSVKYRGINLELGEHGNRHRKLRVNE